MTSIYKANYPRTNLAFWGQICVLSKRCQCNDGRQQEILNHLLLCLIVFSSPVQSRYFVIWWIAPGHTQPQICRWQHPYSRKWRGDKKPLDESERGEWKSWLKAQHSENEDHGMLSFMGSQRVGHDWATELNWTERMFKLPDNGNHFPC